MKSFNELKLRSKLPSRVKTFAKEREAHIKQPVTEFVVEQVDRETLRFVWWWENTAGYKFIGDILEFYVDSELASEIMDKNNPEGKLV